ncbi:MAG: toll/interleukin-1 receptor domain-containing protein [Pyrinomonadaceae bacterium]
MNDDNLEAEPQTTKLELTNSSPLVFISHDTRDAKLAEAFSKLLKSVSSGMIKSFRSSDKSGTDGINYGDEWYTYIMEKLQVTSDVVCLFTERSLERPWILYEAGVAKSKIDTKVMGLALGVPLTRVGSGPFYHFQNVDDSEEELKKLVHQFARRYKGLELDSDVVDERVKAFKQTEAELLEEMGSVESNENSEANSIAKLAEDMKTLPSRVAERLSESGDPYRRRKMRRFHPMMFEEMLHSSGNSSDPVSVLMAASMVRDDLPWLYELAMECYRALKSGKIEEMQRERDRLRKFSNSKRFMMFMEEFGYRDEETHMMSREFPHILEHALHTAVEEKRSNSKKRLPAATADSDTEEEA